MSRLVLISGAVATTMAHSEEMRQRFGEFLATYGAASPLPIAGTQPVGTLPELVQQPVGTQDASPVERRLANILQAEQIDQLNSEVAMALRDIGNAGQEDIQRRRAEESISERIMDKLREAIANALAAQDPPKNFRERIARRARDATIETAISALEAQAQKKEDELREMVRVNHEKAREFVTTEAEEWREFFEENVAEAKDLIAENVAEFKELLLDPSLPATRKFLKENAEELKEYLGENWDEANEFLEDQVEDAMQYLEEQAGEARDFIDANVEWLAENVKRVVGLANLLGFEHEALDALEDFADDPQEFFAEYARKFLEENAEEIREALEDEVEEILEGAKAKARDAVEDFATKVSESELAGKARAVAGKAKSILEAAGRIRDLLDRLGITFYVGDLSKGNAKTDFIADSTRGSHSSARSTMDRFRSAEEVDDMQDFMNKYSSGNKYSNFRN